MAVEKDATVRQVNSLKARISDVDPSALVEDSGTTVQSYGEPSPGMKAVTPS